MHRATASAAPRRRHVAWLGDVATLCVRRRFLNLTSIKKQNRRWWVLHVLKVIVSSSLLLWHYLPPRRRHKGGDVMVSPRLRFRVFPVEASFRDGATITWQLNTWTVWCLKILHSMSESTTKSVLFICTVFCWMFLLVSIHHSYSVSSSFLLFTFPPTVLCLTLS